MADGCSPDLVATLHNWAWVGTMSWMDQMYGSEDLIWSQSSHLLPQPLRGHPRLQEPKPPPLTLGHLVLGLVMWRYCALKVG